MKERDEISKKAEDRELIQASMFSEKQKEVDQLNLQSKENETTISELSEQLDV